MSMTDERKQELLNKQRQQKNEQEYKDVLVVNNEKEFDLFLENLKLISEEKIVVAINPTLMQESVFAEVRNYNYFINLKYNAQSMSHYIVEVMPKLTPITEVFKSEEQERQEQIDRLLDEAKRKSENQEV